MYKSPFKSSLSGSLGLFVTKFTTTYPSLVNVILCKHKSLAFKFQATTEWGNKTCKDL